MENHVQIMGGEKSVVAPLLAIALADCGLSVDLVESPSPRPSVPNPVALALNCASLDMMAARHIVLQGTPVKKIHIYAASHPRKIFAPPFEARAEDIDRETLGIIIWQEDLWAVLNHEVEARGEAITRYAESPKDKEGVFSILTEPTGFGGKDYHQTALTAILDHNWDHQHIATQFFFKTGPLALLPLSDLSGADSSGYQRSMLIWTCPRLMAKCLRDLPPLVFLDFLKEHLPDDKQSLSLATDITAYPLQFSFAKQWIQSDQLIIGQAAHQPHPLAGQGFNICVEDIRVLADFIREARRLGLPIFSKTRLAAYQRERRAHAGALSYGIDFMAHVPFLSCAPAAAMLDGLALTPSARRFLTRLGAGLGIS